MVALPSYSPFPARFSALDDIRAVIAAACNANGIGRKVQLRAELAIEELFANTVHYGYGAETDRPVWIAAHGSADGIEIEYQDEAPAFDPFDTAPALAENLATQRAVGGFGCLLVRNLASRYGYRRDHGRNRITLFLGRDEAPA